ncbi:MAG: molybdopterin-dependent oxidoreductase [Acidimicrobiia bacterium]
MAQHRVISDDPPNAGVPVAALTGEPMGQDDMYVRCSFSLPESLPTGFEVVVPGGTPRFLTVEELSSYRRVEAELVLECAGNGRSLMSPVPPGVAWVLDGVSIIRARGVRLVDVLGRLPDEVVDVVFTGADRGAVKPEGEIPYQFAIDGDMARSDGPILATHIGGEPLSILHGAPVRLLVPGQYAMKSVKWLTRIEAVTVPFEGHFMKRYRYYGDDHETEEGPVGEIAVRSVISSPVDGDTVPAGPLEIRGSAWTGSGRVVGVEVSVDDGRNWLPARWESSPPWAPVRWAATVEVGPGEVVIASRATDDRGGSQPLQARWNANGYANNVVHRVSVNSVS